MRRCVGRTPRQALANFWLDPKVRGWHKERSKTMGVIKEFRDGVRMGRILKAMDMAERLIGAAEMYLGQGGLDRAGQVRAKRLADDGVRHSRAFIDKAYRMTLDTTIPRTHHILMITRWGFLSASLNQLGHSDLANQCAKMSDLLQARFDAGDYYREG